MRFLGPHTTRISFAVLALTPLVFASTLVLTVVQIVFRKVGPAVVTASVALILGCTIWPRALPGAQPHVAGQTLRVASANLYYGQVTATTVVNFVREREVDVLSVQELTPQAARDLREAGLHEVLPHRVVEPRPRAAGSGVYSRYRTREIGLTERSYHAQPSASVDLPGAVDLEVVAVHVVAPVGLVEAAEWADELAALPAPSDSGPARVLAGDFNATLDHAPMREVLSTGYRDAADETGRGLRGTWPTDTPLIPFAAIDHVLVDRRCSVRSFDVIALPGADHHAVLTEVVVASDVP